MMVIAVDEPYSLMTLCSVSILDVKLSMIYVYMTFCYSIIIDYWSRAVYCLSICASPADELRSELF